MSKVFVLAILAVLFQSCISTLRTPAGKPDDTVGTELGASCKYVDLDSLENTNNLSLSYIGSTNQTAAAVLGMLLSFHDNNKITATMMNIVESANKSFAPDDDKASVYDIMVEAENNGHTATIANCAIANLLELLSQKQPVILRIARVDQIHSQYLVATGYNKELKLVYVNDPLDINRESLGFEELVKAWDVNFLNNENNTDNLMIIIR